jgi:imidazoleglycerol-phosphate dehydratase
MRRAEIVRKTNETDIRLCIDLDGSGKNSIKTGCGFLDHMLELFSRHARFDLEIEATGDTYVDYHHTAEDVGIALGQALKQALGDCRGINRYGYFLLPMDEALVLCALDLSGRSCLRYQAQIPSQKIGTFDTELVEEFFLGLTRSAGMTLHMRQMDGTNSHHIVEAMFKALGRALREAVSIDESLGGEIPSTKGVLV